MGEVAPATTAKTPTVLGCRHIAFDEPVANQQAVEKQQSERASGGHRQSQRADRRDPLACVEIRNDAAADDGPASSINVDPHQITRRFFLPAPLLLLLLT